MDFRLPYKDLEFWEALRIVSDAKLGHRTYPTTLAEQMAQVGLDWVAVDPAKRHIPACWQSWATRMTAARSERLSTPKKKVKLLLTTTPTKPLIFKGPFTSGKLVPSDTRTPYKATATKATHSIETCTPKTGTPKTTPPKTVRWADDLKQQTIKEVHAKQGKATPTTQQPQPSKKTTSEPLAKPSKSPDQAPARSSKSPDQGKKRAATDALDTSPRDKPQPKEFEDDDVGKALGRASKNAENVV
ncbi:hypothetical protein F4861DRAFT_544452 [Xylaria intraflava]|nr:hypothetical protein F4861DRAFT_544452 [Xylaria intraflava]